METTARIVLARHGETEANRLGRYQGQADSALTPQGVAQVRALALRLRRRTLTRVISSDLGRARASVEALGATYEASACFRELDVGAWRGLSAREVRERFPEQLRRLEAGEQVRLGGGESYAEFCQRVDAGWARLLEETGPGEQVLVVSHGGVIGALLSGLLDLREARDLPLAAVRHAALHEVELGSRATRLAVFNDARHLEGEPVRSPTELAGHVMLISDPATAEAPAADRSTLAAACTASSPPQVLRLPPAQVRAWAGELLFRADGREARLVEPAPGTSTELAFRAERSALLTYGASVRDDD